MVTRIKNPHEIHRAIYYNENKIDKHDAVLLLAQNFLKEKDELNKVEKKERFDQLSALNQGAGTHALHVMVSFPPEEKLSAEKMTAIAVDYMEQLGFGEQPYLVYQHLDTKHPHLHIVSTSIREDGSTIDMNFLGVKKSEPARKAIEQKYELIRAEEKKNKVKNELLFRKVEYGKTETKRAIVNTLEYVFQHYRFRNLPELNAVLKLVNLKADRGQKGSRTYQHRGLVYQVLDDEGKGVSVPIKASSIYFKPTLAYLEKKFKEHQHIDPVDISRVRQALDAVIRSRPASLDDLIIALRKVKIEAVPYYSKEGKPYGMTFIDMQAKVVLKASDLGKEYSARKILARLAVDPNRKHSKATKKKPDAPSQHPQQEIPFTSDLEKALNILFRPEGSDEPPPSELNKDKKKKKNRKRR